MKAIGICHFTRVLRLAGKLIPKVKQMLCLDGGPTVPEKMICQSVRKIPSGTLYQLMQSKDDYKVVWQSDPIPHGPHAIRKGLGP